MDKKILWLSTELYTELEQLSPLCCYTFKILNNYLLFSILNLFLSRYVIGNNLFLCGNYVFNQYHDFQDENYFLSPDRINDIICLPSKS